MNETLREALPIIFMYVCAFLLAPFICYALYIAFEGDKANAPVLDAAPTDQLEHEVGDTEPVVLTAA